MSKKTRAGFGSAFLAGVTAIALSGCASSGASEADEFAVTACGIEFSDGTGEATFDARDDGAMEAYETTEEQVKRWRGYAAAASSAATADPTYADLKKAASTVYSVKKSAVRVWERVALNGMATRGNIQRFYEFFDDGDIDDHNRALDVWRIECSALTDRLNA